MPRILSDIKLYDALRSTEISMPSGESFLGSLKEDPRITEKLGQMDELILTFHAGCALVTATDQDYRLSQGKIIQLFYDDGSISEWRISSMGRQLSGEKLPRLVGEPIVQDLAKSIVRQRLSTGRIRTSLSFYNQSVSDIASEILSTDYNCPSLFSIGTVESGLTGNYNLVLNAATHLEALKKLSELAECEWRAEYNSGTDSYDINFYESLNLGGGSAQSTDRPIGIGGGRGNRISMHREEESREYFSRVVPLAGQSSEVVNVAGAKWPIASSSTSGGNTVYTLVHSAIIKDGYGMVGGEDVYFAGRRIVSTEKPNKVTVSGEEGSPPDYGIFQVDNDTDLVFIEDADAVSKIGIHESRLNRPDIPPYNNIVSDTGITPDMSDWSGGLPQGWAKITDSETVEEETSELFTRHGRKSAKVTCGALSGLQTDDIEINPSDDDPYFSFVIYLQVFRGSVTVDLIEDDGTVHPKGDVAGSDVNEIRAISVGGLELSSSTCKIRVRARAADTIFYLDAVSFTQSASPINFAPLMGPRDLWIEAGKHLLRYGGKQPDRWTGTAYDEAFFDDVPSAREITIGSWVRALEDYDEDTQIYKTAFDARVVELDYREAYDGRKEKKFTLANANSVFARAFTSRFLGVDSQQSDQFVRQARVGDLDNNIIPPSFVEGYNVIVDKTQIRHTWQPSTDDDIAEYEVRTGGSNWDTATFVDRSRTTSLTSPIPGQGTFTYRLKAIDRAGNYSDHESTAQVTVEARFTGTPQYFEAGAINAIGKTAEALNGQYESIKLDLYTQVERGRNFNILNEAENNFIPIEIGGERGDVYGPGKAIDIPLAPTSQDQTINAPAGSVVALFGIDILAFASVDPGLIQLSTEAEKSALAIGDLNEDITSGQEKTSISLKNITRPIELKDGQKIKLLGRDARLNEELTIDAPDGVTLSSPTDTVDIVSHTFAFSYKKNLAYFIEPGYELSAKIITNINNITLTAQKSQDNEDTIAGVEVQVGDAVERVGDTEFDIGVIGARAALSTDENGHLALLELLSGEFGSAIDIQADQLNVGALTTFESNYNPSLKETPAGAQSKADTAEAAAKEYADGLNVIVAGEISDVNDAVGDLELYVDGSFYDGVIEEAEAQAIQKYLNTLEVEKSAVDSRYTKIYGNSFLDGTAKSNLSTAKTQYNSAHSDLIDEIEDAIADGKTTPSEASDVDDAFDTYKTRLSTLSDRFEAAIDVITHNKADAAEAAAESYADSSVNNLEGQLGDTAFEDLIGAALLDDTIIDGAYFKTSLIDVVDLFAQNISVGGVFTLLTGGKFTNTEGSYILNDLGYRMSTTTNAGTQQEEGHRLTWKESGGDVVTEMYVNQDGSDIVSHLAAWAKYLIITNNDGRSEFLGNGVIIRNKGGGGGDLQLYNDDGHMFIHGLDPTSPGIGISNRVFTQTASQLGGSGSTKVLCIT